MTQVVKAEDIIEEIKELSKNLPKRVPSVLDYSPLDMKAVPNSGYIRSRIESVIFVKRESIFPASMV